MPDKQIRKTLAELHEELARVDNVDPALRDLLRQVDGEIHELLNEAQPEQERLGLVKERLEALGASFAANHPTTERFFQELVATLGRLGI